MFEFTLTVLSHPFCRVVGTPAFLAVSAKCGENMEPKRMKKKLTVLTDNDATEEDLLVDLTFHDVSVGLLMEFAEKIVRPYYAGNLNRALKNLIEKAITKQQLLKNHIIEIS